MATYVRGWGNFVCGRTTYMSYMAWLHICGCGITPPLPLQVKSFKDYVELYVKGVASADEEDEGLSRKVVHEVVSPRWEVAVTASPAGSFLQASFVNSIATTKVCAW